MGAITKQVYYRVIGNAVGLTTHLANSLAMFLAFNADVMKDPDIIMLKGNQFKYITIWNTIFQIVYLSMSLICDAALILKVEHQAVGILRRYSKIFFGGVVWPCSVLIFLIFWPLYLYDRELLFPAYIDKALSQVSNHVMHTSILPIALWALIFQAESKPSCQFWHKTHLLFVFASYFGFLLYNHSVTGLWPYPLLKMIYGTVYFPILFIFFLFLYLYVYTLQWKITAFVYSPKNKNK